LCNDAGADEQAQSGGNSMQISAEPLDCWGGAVPAAVLHLAAGESEPPNGEIHRGHTPARDRVTEVGVVYLVCDEPSLRASLYWLLTSAGYSVEVCAHSDEMLDGADAFENACLLLDLRSSTANGVALLDRLGRRPIFPPVILMTGYDEPLAVIRTFSSSPTAAPSRPFDIGLLERVEGAIAESRRARERDRERTELAGRLGQLTTHEREMLDVILAAGAAAEPASGRGIKVIATAAQRARLLKKLGVPSWSRLAHLVIEIEEG